MNLLLLISSIVTKIILSYTTKNELLNYNKKTVISKLIISMFLQILSLILIY